MIFTLTAKAVIAVNADTGAMLWRFEHITPTDENVLKPIFHDGHVFVSSQKTGSVLLRLAAAGDQISAQPVGVTRTSIAITVVWCSWMDTCTEVVASTGTGGRVWSGVQGALPPLDRGVGKGSLTYADGMLYTRGENGLMGLVQATPAGHRTISQFSPPQEGEGPAWAHPVICGGRLYLRHSDLLYCYDVRQSP